MTETNSLDDSTVSERRRCGSTIGLSPDDTYSAVMRLCPPTVPRTVGSCSELISKRRPWNGAPLRNRTVDLLLTMDNKNAYQVVRPLHLPADFVSAHACLCPRMPGNGPPE